MPLSFADYLRHLRAESERFAEVLSDCDPSAPVPSCPTLTAADLFWHLAEVQRFWARAVVARPAEPPEEPEFTRPTNYRDLECRYHDACDSLAGSLGHTDPDDAAWTWRRPDDTVAFILRRQAHEALIHRIDAELTADESSPVAPRLAADGVLECLDVMYGGQPEWGSWQAGEDYVRLDCTDTSDRVWVRLGRFSGTHPDTGEQADEEDFHVVADPDLQATAVVSGVAADLDRWLWHRSDDSNLHLAGDPGVLKRLLAVLRQPIN